MTLRIIIFGIFLVSCALGENAAPGMNQTISQTCFGCICEAASGCNMTLVCLEEGEVICGPFRITKPYWVDSGKVTLNDEPASASGAWIRCVNDPFCAAKVIQGYMNKHPQDCNGDGLVNCDDYARIHRLGGYGCSGQLDPKYENTYNTCIKGFGL